MEEVNNRNSHEAMTVGNSWPPDEDDEDNKEEKFEKNGEQMRVSENKSNNCTAEINSTGERGKSRDSQSDTLTSVHMSESNFQYNFEKSSELLHEIPVEFSLQPLRSVGELKDQARAIHNEPLKDIIDESAQVQVKLPDGQSKFELSPTSVSVTQSISSFLSPTLPEKKLEPVVNGTSTFLSEQGKQNSPDPKPLSSVSTLKTPDGYNWRKYGQKQSKNPEGSRSYYRYTFADCNCKKIECCDRSNHIVQILYRSHHNHDPPRKVNCTTENRHALPIVPVNHINYPVRHSNDPAPSTSSEEPLKVTEQIPEMKHQDSCDSDETMEANIKEEVDGPEYKRRQKTNSAAALGSSLPKTGNKPKFVVYKADDVGTSGDGYRWRKYGQKMVKWNPHPRNYYRCTSAGCPVRKHIERTADNTSAVVITYKGIHYHDKPVPRKGRSPSIAPLVAAATPISVDNLQTNKTEHYPNQTQWLVDKEGDLNGEALNLGGDKTSESARTLLSIEFEIKPC